MKTIKIELKTADAVALIAVSFGEGSVDAAFISEDGKGRFNLTQDGIETAHTLVLRPDGTWSIETHLGV